jgi:tetratricopeptide (TPR) repeat protein
MAFLDQSHEEAEREEREREEARQREVDQAKALALAEQEKADAMERLAITQKRRAIFASVLSVIAITATVFAVIAWKQAKESEEKAILSLVSGQELLQEDVDKAFEIMKREEDGLPKFAQAMRQKSGSYVNNNDFKSALIAINAANKTDPSHHFSKLYSGRVNMALGNFKQAISDVNTFVKKDTESPLGEHPATIGWMQGASIIAKTSNVKAYLEYSQNMFNRFTSLGTVAFGERVAKGTLMLNSNARQIKTARDYAMKTIEALTENDGFYNWTCFCVGLAEYRSDNLKEAERWCNESLAHTPEAHPFLPGLNNALLSIIYFETDRHSQSNKALETAKQCQDNLKGNDNSLHDKFLVDLLITERELLGSKNSPKESK